ncbi:MAG: hypothetical protein F6K40_18065 [Okeania sp. SIO3I5]|uniref:hypothetical protein n=1 Tax=Okeania sp. SIO3I5 TaxID=2607805 RepID=UPI0013B9BAAF|nr:hypothetical protein [Okeania sp. SIO3I5]NEQ38063.1 hypothetical protein [Okeania sp. SIO3I5]
MENTINCAEACVNGCVSSDRCPNKEYVEETSKFIDNTSLDKMLEMAEEAVKKKRIAPPKWIIPDLPQ